MKEVPSAALASSEQPTETRASQSANRKNAQPAEGASQRRDGWEKFQILAPVLAALIVTGAGGLISYYVSLQQSRRDVAQRRATQEREAEERIATAKREEEFRQNQLKLTRVQTLQGLMPYLTKGQKDQQLAIIALNALGDRQLAAEIARLVGSPGAVMALESIATAKASSEAVPALAAIQTQESAAALARIYRSAVGLMGGPGMSEMDPLTVYRVAVATSTRHAIVPLQGVVRDKVKFMGNWGPYFDVKANTLKPDGLTYLKVEDLPDIPHIVRFAKAYMGAHVVAIGYNSSGNYADPVRGVVSLIEQSVAVVTLEKPADFAPGSIIVADTGDAIGMVAAAYKGSANELRCTDGAAVATFVSMQQ